MPKVGMEPLRRSELVAATIMEIGRVGSLDVTVSQIARKAGVSSALAHHYFGSKDKIFIAAMRHILTVFGAEVSVALREAQTPEDRLSAIVAASFSPCNFDDEVVSAWLNFYVKAQTSTEARRLLHLYQRRLHSNLVYNLRPLMGDEASPIAESIAGMIDGFYIRQASRKAQIDAGAAIKLINTYIDQILRAKRAK